MQHAEGFQNLVKDAKKRIKETNHHEVKKRLDAGEKLILVDTREDSEWARGHIPGAIHLGKGVIERDIENTALLRRRLPLRARRGQLAKDGLHQRHLDGRRLAWLDRSELSRREGVAFHRHVLEKAASGEGRGVK